MQAWALSKENFATRHSKNKALAMGSPSMTTGRKPRNERNDLRLQPMYLTEISALTYGGRIFAYIIALKRVLSQEAK